MIKKGLISILVVVFLASCSSNQIPELTSQEFNSSVNKSFETFNFTNLTALRNLSKTSEEFNLSEFDELVGNLLVENILPLESYTLDIIELYKINQQLELFIQGYLVFNDEVKIYVSDIISNQFLKVLSSIKSDVDKTRFLSSVAKFKGLQGLLNNDFIEKSEQVIDEIYTKITSDIDSRKYYSFSDDMEYILELLNGYKLASKYEKFVEVWHMLNGNRISMNLDFIMRSVKLSYGIPGHESENDLAKVSSAFPLYNQLEGVWRNSFKTAAGRTMYRFVKFDNYHYYTTTSFNPNEIPDFGSYGSDIYVYKNNLYSDFRHDDMDMLRIVNGKLHVKSIGLEDVYEKIW